MRRAMKIEEELRLKCAAIMADENIPAVSLSPSPSLSADSVLARKQSQRQIQGATT